MRVVTAFINSAINLGGSLFESITNLGIGMGMLIGGLASGAIYMVIIGLAIWTLFTIVRLAYEALGKPYESIAIKVVDVLISKKERWIEIGFWMLFIVALVLLVANWIL